MDRLRRLGIIEKFPQLAAWRDALLATPAVKASTVANIEAAWQENLILRNRWLAKFVEKSVVGAAAVE
jgi:glutathione S-transferase